MAHRRRDRILKNNGKVTLEEWEMKKQEYGNRCAICHSEGKLTIDHIIPLSKGGWHRIDNIQPLCLPCNLKKRDNIDPMIVFKM